MICYIDLLFMNLFFIIILCLSYFVFFFFQAEDGIRDFHVTGVQTCALRSSVLSAFICGAVRCFLISWAERLPRTVLAWGTPVYRLVPSACRVTSRGLHRATSSPRRR